MKNNDFIRLINGPTYCPCCGYSVDHEGYCEDCEDCEGDLMPALTAELPEPPPERCFVL